MDKEILGILKNRRFQWAVAIVLFLIILYVSSSIRISNWDLLVDQTTGEKIPSDLDAFYFLRITETLSENGSLPQYDNFRYSPGFQTGWHPEIMPNLIILMQKFVSPWYEVRDVFLASPVIFFMITLIVLFILTYIITKSKLAAVLASAFLGFTPAYLMRTMGGFTDHDAVGIMALLICFLIYYLSLKTIDKKNKNYYPLIFGFLTGLATVFTIATWGGIARSIFLIIPLSFFLNWIFKTKNSKDYMIKGLVFYVSWIIFTLILGPIFKYEISGIINIYLLGTEVILAPIILIFIVADSLLIFQKKFSIKKNYRVLYSFVITILVGIIGLTISGKNVFSMIIGVIQKFIVPFGGGRFGATVAENQAPYLSDWIGQTGMVLFWLFILGVVYFGFEIGKNIKSLKRRFIFIGSYVLMILGIIFSKISETSILNGENIISSAFYFIPLIFFWAYLAWIYFKEDFSFSYTQFFIFAWMFFTIVMGRAAARMFFAITPFVCFMSAYFIISLFKNWKKSKDEIFKVVAIVFFVLVLIASILFIYYSYDIISEQSKYIGPSANLQWQKAMGWVRNSTSTDSIFVHWWDYGYWVESLGERRAVADGGHFQGEEGIHRIGRYVLTTPNPETALSYFKSMNTNYLLIDPTDLGKYPAYSRIGSDESWDRYGFLPIGLVDPTQVFESKNGTIRLYRINGAVDEDITYNLNGKEIFLPGPTYDKEGVPNYKAGIAGILLTNEGSRVLAPEGVFYYNGQQYNIPFRYLFVDGEIHDFGTGLDAIMMIFPSIESDAQGQKMNPTGATIYLSPKVSKSLFAQLYLMDDPFDNYETIKLAHAEEDVYIDLIKQGGNNFEGSFLYYNGFRGPIKIWDLENIPENILERNEFYAPFDGDYAGLDNLQFMK
ncbi:MAG: STT3 domain-containing protein [Candidatus Pacearchaeota archaeon]